MSRPDTSAEDRATMELFGERIDRSTRCGTPHEDAAPTCGAEPAAEPVPADESQPEAAEPR